MDLKLTELKAAYQNKKLELEIAEQAHKPQTIQRLIYKELKQLQYQLVTLQCLQRVQTNSSPA